MTKNVIKTPGRALEIRANVAIAVASRKPNISLLTLSDVINLYHKGRGFARANFYTLCYIIGP